MTWIGLANDAHDALPADDAATFAGDALLSDDVVILHGPPPDPLPSPPFPVGQTAAEGLTLLGYERGARAVETGEVVALALWWSAAVPQPFRQLRLSLAGPDGAARTVVQGQPAYNTYPFDRWQTPAFVIDRQLFAVPDDLPDDGSIIDPGNPAMTSITFGAGAAGSSVIQPSVGSSPTTGSYVSVRPLAFSRAACRSSAVPAAGAERTRKSSSSSDPRPPTSATIFAMSIRTRPGDSCSA